MSIIGGLSKEEEGQIIKEEQNMITEGGSTDEIQVTENTVTTSVLADILSPKNKMGIANEMVQLKKEKTLLERRVQNLEIENVNIHNKTKRIDQGDLNIGKLRTEADDFEPVRCLLTEQDIGARAIRTSKPASIRNSRQKKIIPNLRSEKSATNRPIISTLPSTALGPTKIPKTSYAKMRGSSKGKGGNNNNIIIYIYNIHNIYNIYNIYRFEYEFMAELKNNIRRERENVINPMPYERL